MSATTIPMHDTAIAPAKEVRAGSTGLSLRTLARHAVSIPFFLTHILAVALLIPAGFSWGALAFCVAAYVVRMFAVTAGYHRYFSHRTYKTSRFFQFLLALVGTTCMQKGVLWWASHHRHHHRHSDMDEDVHSPTRRGFIWAHLGWILSTDYDETDWKAIGDFARYPELRLLNRFHLVPGLTAVALIWWLLGFQMMVWGCLVSTVLLWHGTFTINSLSHVFGRRVYKTTDTSRNSFILALITLGEGWHNNHHYYQASANQGFRWYELDISYSVLCLLERLGIIWDMKRAPADVVAGVRAGRSYLVGAGD